MSVCQYCNSLDSSRRFQEEASELSWLCQDISDLYEDNRKVIEKIKSLNVELENLAEQSKFEDTFTRDPDVDELENLENEEAVDEMNFWQAKEESIRWILALQIRRLCADVSSCHLPKTSPTQLQHHRLHAAVVPRHLWGHRTARWRHQQPSRRSAAHQRQGKLLRWLLMRMPTPTILTI